MRAGLLLTMLTAVIAKGELCSGLMVWSTTFKGLPVKRQTLAEEASKLAKLQFNFLQSELLIIIKQRIKKCEN